jgi:hypothetical protein
MEECIICFDETNEFIFYSCTHKVCAKCYPKITNCPMCNTPRELQIVVPTQNTATNVPEIHTTYNIIRCIGSFLIITIFALYFYNDR